MKQMALLGMPNTGKSTLFTRLTGTHARTGNWPGITVDLLEAKILLGGHMVRVVDLPGIYDLHGQSEDERVATQFLETHHPDLLLFVMNTAQWERQLDLLAEVMARGLQVVVALTMADEATGMGIRVDPEKLSEVLGIPICLISAKYGDGLDKLRHALSQALQSPQTSLPTHKASSLESASLVKHFSAHFEMPLQASHRLTLQLDRVLLHPWLGLPIFFAVMLLVFQAVFALGKPLQDGTSSLFEALRQQGLEPVLASLPHWLQGLILDGVYNGLATVAGFVPLIVLFFLFLGLIEDTGYLSRAAFLLDALMARLGLDGRSFVMLLMGFGCNVPALMGTRVIRSRELRWLTMLTIPFSLCSARLQVFVFFAAALFTPQQAPWVLFSLYLLSILAAMGTAFLMKGQFQHRDAFVLEIPPYRWPTARQVLIRGWQEVRHFLHRASRFIILGVVLVWLLTHLPMGVDPASAQSWAGQLGQLLQPILSPLGIEPQLAVALLFGFVAKEIVLGSLAVIYGMEGQALAQTLGQQLHWSQAYSFMLFTLLYTPCLSTIATLRNESKSLRFTVLNLAWGLGLAWLVSFGFYQLVGLG